MTALHIDPPSDDRGQPVWLLPDPGDRRRQFDSFLWWTLCDAWRAGRPDAIDATLSTWSRRARNAALPQPYRIFAGLHVLHAPQLAESKAMVEDELARGVPPLDTLLHGMVETVTESRRPLPQMLQLAESFDRTDLGQLTAYLANPDVPEDVRLSTEFLLQAAKASPEPTAPAQIAPTRQPQPERA